MKLPESNRLRTFILMAAILIGIGGSVLYRITMGEGGVFSCRLESKNFTNVIGFDYANDLIVLKVSFHGSAKSYDFILDPGAKTIFSDSLVSVIGREHFRPYAAQTEKSGYAVKNQIVSLDTMKIGSVTFSEIGGLLVSHDELRLQNALSSCGVIGYNVLQSCSFKINYDREQIIITDREKNLNRFPLFQEGEEHIRLSSNQLE